MLNITNSAWVGEGLYVKLEDHQKQIAELEAENKRLRGALFRIANGSACGAGTCMNCDTINQIANTTLDFEPARAAALDEA